MIRGRALNAELLKDARYVFSTAAVLISSVSAIPRFDLPSASWASTSRSRSVVRERPPTMLSSSEHSTDNLGIERGPSGRDPGHGVDERLYLTHALFQQVADALRASGEKVHSVHLLVMPRQHQDARSWQPLSHLERGADAVRSLTRRHLDVHDGDVGAVRERLAHEVLRVSRPADHVEPGVGEQPGYPFTKENVVLRNDYA